MMLLGIDFVSVFLYVCLMLCLHLHEIGSFACLFEQSKREQVAAPLRTSADDVTATVAGGKVREESLVPICPSLSL